MNSFAHQRAAVEARAVEARTDGLEPTKQTLILKVTEDGWSLVGPNGKVAFRGLGKGSRRQCLEFAREHGVLWMRS